MLLQFPFCKHTRFVSPTIVKPSSQAYVTVEPYDVPFEALIEPFTGSSKSPQSEEWVTINVLGYIHINYSALPLLINNKKMSYTINGE